MLKEVSAECALLIENKDVAVRARPEGDRPSRRRSGRVPRRLRAQGDQASALPRALYSGEWADPRFATGCWTLCLMLVEHRDQLITADADRLTATGIQHIETQPVHALVRRGGVRSVIATWVSTCPHRSRTIVIDGCVVATISLAIPAADRRNEIRRGEAAAHHGAAVLAEGAAGAAQGQCARGPASRRLNQHHRGRRGCGKALTTHQAWTVTATVQSMSGGR